MEQAFLDKFHPKESEPYMFENLMVKKPGQGELASTSQEGQKFGILKTTMDKLKDMGKGFPSPVQGTGEPTPPVVGDEAPEDNGDSSNDATHVPVEE